jgi:2-oxoisovalerate dehydrogenase E1 component
MSTLGPGGRVGLQTRTASLYDEFRDFDPAEDLDDKTLHVTANGVRWEAAQRPSLSRAQLLELYYYLVLTRALDHEIVKLSRKGKAFGKHLLCTGNEATAVGATYALGQQDWVTLAIRDLGAFVVRGVPASRLLAQACGRTNGLTAGWDGSLHMGSRPDRIAGLVSHLGTLAAVGAGCAFAEKYRGTEHVVLAFVGDGATSTGDFHEAMNMASVLQLPLVLVIENNQWAFGTPSRLQYAVPTLALRALAYGPNVEGVCIDGTDVLTVYETVRSALERARRERIITIVEAVSMRLEGHSLADPFKKYVPAEQLAVWQAKDPIDRFRSRLSQLEVASHRDLLAITTRVNHEVMQAVMEAEAGPVPTGEDIEGRVFVPSEPAGEVIDTMSADGCQITYHRAIHTAIQEEMDRDDRIFIVGEDVGISDGAFKITAGLSKRFDGIDWRDCWNSKHAFAQRRVIDAPIAEAGFCGLALGAALNGLRPIVEFQYADFASEAFKMIVNYAATQNVRGMGPVPIVFRLPSGWAPNTSLYHSVNPESWFASTPGLKIVAPITAFDAKGLLKAAIRDDNPVLFLEYKAHYRVTAERLPAAMRLPIPDRDYVVPIGKARVLKTGADLTIVTFGSQVVRALEAASIVEREDAASVEVIDLRTIVPCDLHCIIQSVRKTGRALVTCEAPRTGCFGNTIVTQILRGCFEFLDAPIRLVAAADTPVPFAPALEAAHLPTTEKVIEAIRELLTY